MIKYCCNCGTPVQYENALICEYCGYSFAPVKIKQTKNTVKTFIDDFVRRYSKKGFNI